jgi:hypothetical protein
MNIWGSKLMRMEYMIQEFRTISLGRCAIYTNGILWDRRVTRKINEVSTQDRNKMLYYVVKKYGRFKDTNKNYLQRKCVFGDDQRRKGKIPNHVIREHMGLQAIRLYKSKQYWYCRVQRMTDTMLPEVMEWMPPGDGTEEDERQIEVIRMQ